MKNRLKTWSVLRRRRDNRPQAGQALVSLSRFRVFGWTPPMKKNITSLLYPGDGAAGKKYKKDSPPWRRLSLFSLIFDGIPLKMDNESRESGFTLREKERFEWPTKDSPSAA